MTNRVPSTPKGWIFGPRAAFVGAALVALLASPSGTQIVAGLQEVDTPTFRVQVWGYIVADFSTRVQSYFDLRSKLEDSLPRPTVTDDVAEIRKVRRTLAKAIQAARHGAPFMRHRLPRGSWCISSRAGYAICRWISKCR